MFGDDGVRLNRKLVSHDNMNIKKDSIRNDFSTSQFCVIGIFPSMLAPFPYYTQGTLDIKSAYLQGGNLPWDVYKGSSKDLVIPLFRIQ